MIDNTAAFKYKPNFKKRIFATLVNYGIYFLAYFCYLELFGHDNDEGGKTVNGLLTLPVPAFWFLYFVIVEAYYGATIGHSLFYLKVLTLNRKEISFEHTFKRHLLDLIDIFIYGIPAIIAIRSSDKHQRLGDMWANTIVVDTTDPEQYLDPHHPADHPSFN